MKSIFLFLFLAGFSCILQAQTVYPLTGHPRLFFLSSDEAVLKEKLSSNPLMEKAHQAVLAECDKMIGLPVQQRVLTGIRLLSISREAIRRICFLSYAYRMTGDVRYASRAETEMLGMAAFTDWNPSHFLDVAEMTLAMAIGYDWLFNYLSEESRVKIAAAVKSKGIEQTTGSKANQSWMSANNNWNQVCNAGISAGIAAVYDEDPVYYQTLIDRAVTQIKIPMGVYQYNGSYPEGVGYWEYGTTFNILFIDMLQRMWGTDRDLRVLNGFMKTTDFVMHAQGNATKQMSGGTLKSVNPLPFNFADCGSGIGVQPGMFWLARESGNPSSVYNELKKLDFTLTNNAASLVSNRLLPFLLIWSMNLKTDSLQAPVEKTYIAQGPGAIATLRSGWGASDIYLAVKGGTPSSNHAHMDIGSFVMEAMDVRWAMDFGMSDYNRLESNGVDLWNMSQTSERWDVFRLNNMAHNTLTINGNKQLVTGKSTIDNPINNADLQSVDLNLTSLYLNDVNHYKRTAAIISNRYVQIRDSVSAGLKPLSVRWNLLTQAVPQKVSDRVIRLAQADKVLYLVFDGTDDVTAMSWPTKPPTSYEEQNTDTWFTGFQYSIPAGTSQTVTVKLVPEGDPVLAGLELSTSGIRLDETFESFNTGSLSGGFVYWKMNPASDGSLKAIRGEVVANPHKNGINLSNKVLKIERQDDSGYITSANAGNLTYRGVQAYGYDLRLNTGSVVEFKYYKESFGKVGVRVYDGNGNMVLADYSDPNESIPGFSTARWRTAQFAIGQQNLTNFDFTASGYLLISPERNGTESHQEKALTMYVDDVKMLPLSPTAVEKINSVSGLTAFYDQKTNRICVIHIPEDARFIRLYDVTGRLLQEVQVSGDMAFLSTGQTSASLYIVRVINSKGFGRSVKVSNVSY